MVKVEYEGVVREILYKFIQNEEFKNIDIKYDLQYCGLNSLNCISLIVLLEDKFNIQFDEENIRLSKVRTIFDINKLIVDGKELNR